MHPNTPQVARWRRAKGGMAAVTALAVAVPTAALTATSAAGEDLDCSSVPWMDTSLSAQERAQAILDASDQHQIYRWLVEQPANDPDRTEWPGGVVYPEQVDCTPDVVYANGPEGLHNTAGSTAWPAPIALAATWDTELAVNRGAAIADEVFDKGRNVILGPGIASGRHPVSGRTSEYFGEDPILSGLIAASSVRGIEDENDPTKPVVSNLKHYVGNEQEEDRESSSSNIDERTLREWYSLPYEIAVERSDPGSVMCAYNQINGVYACENPILNTVLKEAAGFEGYVMSDFGAVHSTADALNNGLDQELNRPVWFTPDLLDAAFTAGDITQERIEEAAMRVLATYIGEGLFDHALPDAPVAVVSTPEHKELARTIAEDATVLLRNDGTLPLSGGQSVAVFGATASTADADGPNAVDACASFIPFGGGFPTLNCDAVVAPVDALTERAAEAGGSVVFNDGTDLDAAAADAAAADVAIVFGHYSMGEFSDIADLRLDNGGDALIEAVAGANGNTVVVLQTGSAVEMPWIEDVGAVMQAWYAGEQMGPALAGLIYGDVAPSGKLPMTFPVSLADTPAGQSEARYPGILDGEGFRQVDYSEGLSVGYRWYEDQGIEPLFPFGHGLTYTDFEYSKLQVTPSSHRGDREIRVKFRLTNTGDVTATETPQVYLELPVSAGEPSKRLAAWEDVTLKPGERKNVTIRLSEQDIEDLRLLEYWDDGDSAWTDATGTFTVHVGGSSDTVLDDTFRHRADRLDGDRGKS